MGILEKGLTFFLIGCDETRLELGYILPHCLTYLAVYSVAPNDKIPALTRPVMAKDLNSIVIFLNTFDALVHQDPRLVRKAVIKNLKKDSTFHE